MLGAQEIDRVKQYLKNQKTTSKKPKSVVLKLGTDCNLRCKYCYVPHTGKELSLETVEKLFDELMTDNPFMVDCCFHGGEPLFYMSKIRSIIELLESKPYAKQLRFSCQSNGTLLNKKTLDFIEEHNVSIGISIDGPQSVNDSLRVFPDGSGSFDAIMKGIKLLRERNIGFSVLSVLTDHNAKYVCDTLQFLKEQHISIVDFKPCFKTGKDTEGLSKEMYAKTMIDIIDWLIEHNTEESKSIVREVEVYTNLVMHDENLSGCYDCRSMCDMMNCGAGRDHITVDVDGSVYVCDRLYGHKEYVLGNVNSDSLESIMQNKMIDVFLDRKISCIPECEQCDENRVCFLGCPATNILQKGNLHDGLYSKPEYCDSFYQIIKKIRKVVNNGDGNQLIRTKSTKIQ